MFYNEDGKHVRTKKEILDENGNLREGCRIIPKGEVYESHMFAVKNEHFKSKTFTREVKEMYTKLMNQYVKEESQKLSVFQPEGVYLATKKSGRITRKRRKSGRIMWQGRNGTVLWMSLWQKVLRKKW